MVFDDCEWFVGYLTAFLQLEKLCEVTWKCILTINWFLIHPTYSCETCQYLEFPLHGLRAQSWLSPVVSCGQACFGMAFPSFLVKQLYRCDSVVIASLVGTGYTARRWGWLLGRRGCSITHHRLLYINKKLNNYLKIAGVTNNMFRPQ